MAQLIFLSKIEQVAAHLQQEVMRGRWVHQIPGREEISSEIGVNSKTVEAALKLMEKRGILIPQGTGKRRRISDTIEGRPPALTIRLMIYEWSDRTQTYNVEVLHQLSAMGHTVMFSEKSLRELDMDLEQVANFVKNNPADAWVVMAGPKEILAWFAEQKFPTFAQFGRSRDLPIAGVRVNKTIAMVDAVGKLISLGHRRIVMLSRTERRKPDPGMLEKAFLEELEKHGIKTGSYHLPDWNDTIADFHRCLDSLFSATPPTAIFISEAPHFIAAQQHLIRKGITAPRDVSLICDDPNLVFSWCQPSISHMTWDAKPVVASVLQWAKKVSRGKSDLKQKTVMAKFIEGGTIGPVPMV